MCVNVDVCWCKCWLHDTVKVALKWLPTTVTAAAVNENASAINCGTPLFKYNFQLSFWQDMRCLLFSYTFLCMGGVYLCATLASFVTTLTRCAFIIVLPCWWQFMVVFRFAHSLIMSSVLMYACMYLRMHKNVCLCLSLIACLWFFFALMHMSFSG